MTEDAFTRGFDELLRQEWARRQLHRTVAHRAVLTAEQRAKLFDPQENMRAAVRCIAKRYPPLMPAWEPWPLSHRWFPPFCRGWWRAVGREMRREFMAAWRAAAR